MTPTEARALAKRIDDGSLEIADGLRRLNPNEVKIMLSMRDFFLETRTALRSLADQVEALEGQALSSVEREEYFAMKADAKRYRHLKQQIADGFWQVADMVITDSYGNVCPEWFGDYLDERVDRAREAT